MSEHEPFRGEDSSPEPATPRDPSPVPFGSSYDEHGELTAPDELTGHHAQHRAAGSRRRKRRGGSGCVPVLVVILVIAVAAYIFVPKAISAVKDHFASAPDYPGPGTGSVCFVVKPGDSVTTTGNNLKAAGVVASVDAFTNAAAGSIRDGSYELRKQMKASDAFSALTSKTATSCLTNVTILAGHTESETIDLLAKATGFSKKSLVAAAKDTSRLGLPSYAGGNVEGYLGPGTYQVEKGDSAVTVLKKMVASFTRTASQVGLVSGAARLGYTPEEIVVVASLLQKEVGTPTDMAKVARVIYNRLENPGTQGTSGYLQLDSTINYATGKQGFDLSPSDLGVDSPYNTRTHAGLPPGPINSPSKAALQAALKPAAGDWYYYVTVNPRTQETKFAATYAEFLQYKAEFTAYCQTSNAC